MAYENLCMYCFQDLNGESICPHCGKDARAAVPQIQMLPGTLVYRDRFLVGRALGQDSGGIVYTALDTKRGGTIRIREYLPRNCAERLNDGSVVPIAGMEDAFEAGMQKLRASVESVEDPKKRHFYFEENGTAYIAQRKNGAAPSHEDEVDDDLDEADHRKKIVLYICIAAAVVLVIALGLVLFLNSMSDPDDVTIENPLATVATDTTWMPLSTPTPTPYATATFAALVDPELSWMDYTYNGDVEKEYNQQQQQAATPTKKPTIITEEKYDTVNNSSSTTDVTSLQNTLVKLGWLSSSNVTGKYDAATKQAVKDFQTYVNENCSPAKKLAVDGIAGQKTLQWLYNSSVSLTKPTPTPKPLVTAAPDKGVINAGSSKSAIRGLQQQLIALGLLPEGSADGVFGSSTTTAVKNFQIRVNQLQGYNALNVDGVVDELTQAYLDYYVDWWLEQQAATPTPAPTATATPKPMNTPQGSGTINGSSSRAEITQMQELLEAVGLLKSSDVDGKYGKGTTAAVKAFQQYVNENRGVETLAVTGECDLLTQQYLRYCVENGMKVSTATQAPTQVPTQAPTQVPTQVPTEEPTVAPVEDPDYTEDNNLVDASSPKESIRYVQEMLSTVGLLKSSDVDGSYGNRTINAVVLFQQWVNQEKGSQVLEVTGICDALTLQYLEYCSDNGWNIGAAYATQAPTEAPTPEPTPVPTEEPTVAPEEDPDYSEGGNIVVDGSSPKESIRYVQEMLSAVGLLTPADVDGSYGNGTVSAVVAFQQWVNQEKGEQVLEVTGVCDALTLQYLEYCYSNEWTIGGASATDAPVETSAPEPEQPAVGTVEDFRVQVNGMSSDGSIIEVPDSGKFSITWGASGAAGYSIYLYDEDNNLINSTDATTKTEMTVNSKDMSPGKTYTLRVGALPENGGEADIVWQTIQLARPAAATAEPTQEPTPEPTRAPSVNAPVINIGSSVYQENGVTYISGSSIIFSWMAEGDVDHYTATLSYEDGTDYSLGSTNDTGKTVETDYLLSLKGPGLWRLTVGAVPLGGSEADAVWNQLVFGVPGAAEPEAPVEPDVPADSGSEQLTYIDAASDPNDIQSVQWALYKYGLINADNAEPGVLDAATLEAVAAFQMKVNELYGANLTVIDPAMDSSIDEATLNYLLYQELNLNP